MARGNKTEKAMLNELICGNLFIFLIGEGIIFLLARNKWSFSFWFLLGICFACFWVWHMQHTIENSMEREEKEAWIAIRKAAFFRWLFFVVLFLIVSLLKLGNVLAFFFGIFSLKISAYLQPVIHKLFLMSERGEGHE